MKICILGVGKSGTTVLYSILQEIFSDLYVENVSFIYEPFLWGELTWNKRLREIGPRLSEMSSFSIEGMYQHQELPLFITDPGKYNDNRYLKQIFNTSDKNSHVLLKFIRACGRFPLLRQICPRCIFIFIIRNPLDVINSVLNRFSFFGGDYHKDDFSKFVREVNDIFKANINPGDTTNRVRKEVAYWYYMNRFILEQFSLLPDPPFIICYEDFADKKNILEKMCKYLNVEYNEKYYEISQKRVGPVSRYINLSLEDFEILKKYLQDYPNLLKEFNISNSFCLQHILSKYENKLLETREEDPFYRKVPVFIKDRLMESIKQKDEKIRQQDEIIREKEQDIQKKIANNLKKQRIIEQKDGTLREKEQDIQRRIANNKEKQQVIEQKDKIILEKQQIIQQKDEIIREKEEDIQRVIVNNKEKQKVIEQKDCIIKEKQQIIKQKDETIREKEEDIQRMIANNRDKQQIIEQKDHNLREKQQIIQQLTEELESIEHSKAYKIIKFFSPGKKNPS